jgi:uncharacterized protein YndB with AHSA1/START domain
MSASDTDFIFSRTFKAPRALVFKAWSEAEALAQWWGPKGFGLRVKHLDFRAGGSFHYCMVLPDGKEMWGKFVYREINAPESIVFINSFADADANIIPNPWMAGWPLEVLNRVSFTEQGGETTVTLRGGPLNPTPEELAIFKGHHASMRGGFGGTFDQLEAYLANILAEGK